MRSNKSHRVISLLMALLLLVPSTGYSIDLHYCQGNLKSFSLFGKAKSCHTQSKNSHCAKKKMACHASFDFQKKEVKCKKDCCSNKMIKVEGSNDNKKIEVLELHPIQVKFIKAFVQVYILEKFDLSKAIIKRLNYIPPLLNKDISVFIQSFLL